jgi:hypothetical protein
MKNKKILEIILYVLIGVPLLSTFLYYGTVVYDFPKAEKFNGRNFYNPYESISGKAYKANLHCHSKGFCEARKSTQKPENLQKVYSSKGYSILTITNHNKITKFVSPNKNFLFIPSYEYGRGLTKNHVLVFGAKHKTWLHFPYMQNVNQKQTIIDEVRDDGQLTSLAHPARSGYELEDMKSLSGFNCIEVSNAGKSSTDYWDILLSNGRAIWLTAGDDSHDITASDRSFRSWTWVFSDYLTQDSIISALRYGKSYAVSGIDGIDKNKLVSCTVYDNYVHIEFEKTADTIRLFGQNGKLIWLLTHTNQADYIIGINEKYIRAEAVTDHSVIYMNPIIRIKDTYKPYRDIPTTDTAGTWLFRSILFLIHFTIFGFYYLMKKKFNKNSTTKKQPSLYKSR